MPVNQLSDDQIFEAYQYRLYFTHKLFGQNSLPWKDAVEYEEDEKWLIGDAIYPFVQALVGEELTPQITSMIVTNIQFISFAT